MRYCDNCGEMVTNIKYMRLINPALPEIYDLYNDNIFNKGFFWISVFWGVIPTKIDLCSKCFKKYKRLKIC